MKVVGTVSPLEVPRVPGGRQTGVWTGLAQQVINAHTQADGGVLVVEAESREELKRMTNGMAEKLRDAGYSRSFTAVDNPDGSVTVYCQLVERETDGTVVVRPITRRRRKSNG